MSEIDNLKKNCFPENSPLGKKVSYISTYTPDLLFAVPRAAKRAEMGIEEQALPFQGVDLWNAFEISWLNQKGKPVVALGEFSFPCASPSLIESKSLKLYLNSFNQTRFLTLEEVEGTIRHDLTRAAGLAVSVNVVSIETAEAEIELGKFSSPCIDSLDIVCDSYQPQPDCLVLEEMSQGVVTEESFHTNLLKSNCLVTGQPDWASLEITYRGKQINRAGFLKYIVSLRDHNEFHEQCVERIFVNIMKYCQPQSLTVYARYTRRGGLDINPVRTTEKNLSLRNIRLCRQ